MPTTSRTISPRSAASASALAALALVACSSATTADGREGNLGHGIFTYQCQNESDPTCPAGSNVMPGCEGSAVTCFPSAIALSGRFRIQYTPGSSTGNVGNPNIEPVSTDYLTAAGDGIFQAIKAGYVGVVAESTVSVEVVDYTLIKITPIASIRIQDASGNYAPAVVSLIKGAQTKYKLVALGQATEQLAGAIDYTWTSSNPMVALLTQGNPTASMTIEAAGVGTATITATVGSDVTATLDITVLP